MRVELSVADFQMKPSIEEAVKEHLVKPNAYSFILNILVAPDPSAKRAIAGAVRDDVADWVNEQLRQLGRTLRQNAQQQQQQQQGSSPSAPGPIPGPTPIPVFPP